ncbi:transcription factor IIA, alpha/beta subunit [Phascolomyces articulosus]|uniref:Transcription factor IIA, alpha/beta subunit n=1 Tax=Phascolomyces articulosus TaxID=60185 RepID=A0AAD5K4B0_9FUNG|nr:transcription factor IIA, alpha/beta subunit [Phascolomyces articulosus]
MTPNTSQPQQQPAKPAQDLQLPGGGNNSNNNASRPNIPQNDGAADSEMTTEQIDAHIAEICNNAAGHSNLAFTATSSSSGESIPFNNLPEDVKVLMRDARVRAVKAGAIRPNTRIPQLDGEGDGADAGDDDINSDLDDSDDADDDADGGEEIEHIILCLYDKVTRTKNKWKCVLKDGIMLVNGRDYLFHRASGDFEW